MDDAEIMNELEKARKRKKLHRATGLCVRGGLGGCTECHFWSGAIAALGNLVGQPGIID